MERYWIRTNPVRGRAETGLVTVGVEMTAAGIIVGPATITC
jgi:hypothetical protein